MKVYRQTFQIRIPDRRYKVGFREDNEGLFTNYWATLEEAQEGVARCTERLIKWGYREDEISYKIVERDIQMDEKGIISALRDAVSVMLW